MFGPGTCEARVLGGTGFRHSQGSIEKAKLQAVFAGPSKRGGRENQFLDVQPDAAAGRGEDRPDQAGERAVGPHPRAESSVVEFASAHRPHAPEDLRLASRFVAVAVTIVLSL